MSKDARNRRPVNRHTKHEPQKPVVSIDQQQKIKGLIILIAVGILAGVPFIMGKYCEFNTPDAFDSGCYVYSAEHILNGAQIGVDELPSAKIGTLLVNMLGVRLFDFSEFGPKLIQTFLQAGALFFMFFVLLQVYGVLPASVGVIIASIYLSAPVISKAGNVKEQYMIAFMILGISTYILGQLRGKWIYTLLAGAFVSLGPMFKETGVSAIAAIGLFVLVQPVLKHATWKQTGKDILLLFAGALIFIMPISLWLTIQKAPAGYYPYAAFWKPILKHIAAPAENNENADNVTQDTEDANDDTTLASTESNKTDEPGFLLRIMPGYVRDSWMIMNAQQRVDVFKRVFRWYYVLLLPVALALGAIIVRIFKVILNLLTKAEQTQKTRKERFVLLFALWWFFDMSLIWISPRSYEQYYLPLNASAAMLGGYFIMAYREKLNNIMNRPKWIITGIVGLLVMVIMVWPIFFGVGTSPHSGVVYKDPSTGEPEKRNGYAQRLREASAHAKGARAPWENIGEFINKNSKPDDGIYVWGWYPGIYVAAQRLSPSPKAFEGNMHTLAPDALRGRINDILSSFRAKPPKFIVDSRKNHFPWDRPPLELWPIINSKLLPIEPRSTVNEYDRVWESELRKQFGEDEALRYRAMNQFRIYIRNNYDPIIRADFGGHILFKRKGTS